MTLKQLREKSMRLPLTPGVYLMHDKEGNVIYVGKAKALKNRVSQYFAPTPNHSYKTARMVSKVSDFEVINAPTEFDALVLENTLIKKYKPKYNILLKDDKGYPFIKLSEGEYPRFSIEGKRAKGGKYFGPYGGRGTANAAIRAVNEIFSFPSCSKVFPRDIGKERPCLQYHIGKCCGVCTGEISAEEYSKRIAQASLLFEGKGSALERQLQTQMEACAEELDFERAAILRDRLNAIKSLRTNAIVSAAALSDADAIGYYCKNSRGCVAALSYIDGNLADKRIIFFDGADSEDAPRDIESFINQYYTMMGRAPKEIYLSCEIESLDATQQMLTELRGSKCSIYVPQKGEKKKMTDLATENAKAELELAAKKEEQSKKTLTDLGKMLGIPTPKRIEAFDISNTAGSDAVASMTVFAEGKPLKSGYKKFKIKEAAPGDDPAAIGEVLGRRLDRALSGDEGFLPLPDLFLMDGGITQTQSAKRVLESRKVDIPVFGMVKDDKHRTRGLISCDGDETGLTATPAIFALVGRIQEETHRFAVAFHQDLRRSKIKTSKLDKIEGVGEARKKALLKTFKTIKAISQADVDMLMRVVPRDVAENIVNFFEGEKDESNNR